MSISSAGTQQKVDCNSYVQSLQSGAHRQQWRESRWLDPWTGTKVTTDYDAYGKHGIPLYTAPQPFPTAQADSQPAPVSSDTLYLLRRLLSNQHTLTSAEFCEELTKIVGEAAQAEVL